MELQFENDVKTCLRKLNCNTQTKEETQDIRLPDTMPDIGKVLGCWGQILIRGKEWKSDSITVSGGVMTWTLYEPEEESEPRCVEGWIPFQMKWDVSDSKRDGFIWVVPTLKSMDVRSVSARKFMVRTCISMYVQALEPMDAEIPKSGQLDPDVQILPQVYPMELPVEYGEKQFSLDDEVTLPNAYPKIEKILYYTIVPRIAEYKVMASRLVFRGSAELTLLYRGADGSVHRWQGSIPFSQFTDLDREHSSSSSAELSVLVTGLELEFNEENNLMLKCTLAAQFVIYDLETLCIIEDAYSTSRKVTAKKQTLNIPVRLDDRIENAFISGEQRGADMRVIDLNLRMDHPIRHQQGDLVQIEIPCQIQILYFNDEDRLQVVHIKSEAQIEMGCDPENEVYCYAEPCGVVNTDYDGEKMTVNSQADIHISTCSSRGLCAVCGLEIGETKSLDPSRPSVILRRAGEDRLWDIAKEYGSTMEAIRNANQLQNEPSQNQMLLIPLA